MLVLAVAFALCRLPLPTSGVAGALSVTLALTAAVTLLQLLLARLAACDTRDPALIACAGAGAVLAYLLRKHGAGAPVSDLAFDLALVATAAAGGRLFANQVQEAWWIVPLGLAGAAADMFSVFVPGAPTYEMVASGSPVLEYLLLVWPGFHDGPARGFCGVSDLVIAAILYALSVRFALDAARSFALLTAALLFCLVLAGLAGIGLPAIPFLFTFYVAGHARELHASWHGRKKTGHSH